jgi:outer membrane protein OmpA-like peptidoglycan-associated protein/Tol biopolymer transport system component
MKTVVFTLFSFIFLSFSSSVLSQEDIEENENCSKPAKKAMKLLDKGLKNADYTKRLAGIGEAIKLQPENAYLYNVYANEIYTEGNRLLKSEFTPDRGLKTLKTSRQAYLKVLKCCSNYSAEAFNRIISISFQNNEIDIAVEWMNRYLESENNFLTTDSNFEQNKKKYESYIREIEEEKAFYGNQVPFNPKLVKNVSSENEEYFPMISPDNELIFYTRKLDKRTLGDIKGKIVEEFTFSTRPSAFTDFSNGEAFRTPFNDGTFSNYGAATMSVDNKEMIICACKEESPYGKPYLNCDLYTTTFKRTGAGGNDFSWTPLVNLGASINTPDGWEGQPCLSSDGKTLYFTTSRAESQDNDIYVSLRDEKGNWMKAVPFYEANTPGKDKSPFFHQDGETFYFVSSSTKDRKGFGGLDIFYMRRENGKWTKPKNIGSPINTEGDEIGLFVSTDGKKAFYSGRNQSDWNIYSFDLYEEARPKEVVILKGELKDENGKPVTDAKIEINYTESGKTETIQVNGDDGKYAAVVKVDKTKNEDILITASKEGHSFEAQLIRKENLSPEKITVKAEPLKIEKLKEGGSFEIDNLLFTSGSADLLEKSKIILNGFARYLQQNPSIQIEIQGHTDDLGDDATNLKLSENRCQAVFDYLISKGVDKANLSFKGYGETKPKFPNSSDENRAKNRRTEVKIKQF